MDQAELIRECQNDFPDDEVMTLLQALECYYMNGTYDDVSGDVESPSGHFYRIEQWVVQTNERGFTTATTFDTVEAAIDEFEKLDKLYDEWYNG